LKLSKLLSLLSIFSFFIGSLSSCVKKNTSGDFGLEKSKTLRMRLTGEPPTLDWHKASDTESSLLMVNLMEGLVTYAYTGDEVTVVPALAESWESKKQARVWDFKIRKGVTWSDGEPFEPKHILDGWERLLNPKTASQYAYFLYAVKNARAYNEGKITDFSKVGVSLEGHKLRVELNHPLFFPYLLTHSSTFPIRKDIVEKFKEKWTEPENIVTLGPFELKKWVHDQALVMKKSPTYFGSAARTENIIFYVIQEHQTAINLFEMGKLDVIRVLPPKDLPALKRLKEYYTYPNLSTYYFGFNTEQFPTDNKLVRRALVHAVDRQQIIKILQGDHKPLTGWIPHGMFGHNSDVGLAFDPVRAKSYLKEAGFDEKNPAPKIELSFNTLEAHKTIAENIQAQIKENLGIQVEIKNEEWKVYLESLKVKPTHIYRMGWVADYPDPNNFFEIMLSYSDNNRTKWKNKEYDKLIEMAAGEIEDKAKRLELYNKAHELLVSDEVPVFPIYTSVAQHLIATRVISFPTNVMREFRLKNTSLQ